MIYIHFSFISFLAVKCPKLNSISLSQVNPPECVTKELKFNTRCTFECPKGYVFKGGSHRSVLRFCQTDGTWTGEHKPCVGEPSLSHQFRRITRFSVF